MPVFPGIAAREERPRPRHQATESLAAGLAALPVPRKSPVKKDSRVVTPRRFELRFQP